ncbi:hypothetical protein ALC57_14592 [Trachymyrmex cornetzi]|uniref:DNA-directed DNA polymerase n=1 Tax=Trachymyrmex cornetzi TaxID=471704 RepID=A0A151IY44_9HYME|nr:hypothetical protein ALC57_14592 [Trachymyrmex cornetzi]
MEFDERVERVLEQCGQVATLMECFAWLERCEECIERLEELCRAKHARETVLEQVRDAVERHGSAKVNIAFNGEFATNDALNPAEKYTERESSYPHYTAVLNLAGIEFPMNLKDIQKFEQLNAVSINVYSNENKQILPVRLTSDKKEKHINILYLQDPRNDSVGHIAWIKNLSRLVSSQLSRQKNKKFFCDRTSEKLELHAMDCRKINDCAIRLPSEDDKWLKFGNHCNKERIPFVVYADLECVLCKTEPNREDASSYTYQQHEVCSIDYYVRCSTKDKNENHFQKNFLRLRSIDSFKFLSASLDKLASYLDKDKLKIVRSEFSTLSDEEFELLTRKDVFPYEYVDCVEKLQDTRLPPRELFFSSLTGDTVSESDYAHAVNVWQRFSIRTLGEYSDVYLKTDVLLLADIFENFRNSCVASYGLDPAHYYTLPGFTWDAMLKHTRIRFELLTDIDMVMFIERGIRGGLSQCSNKYAQANNKYMRSYDSSKPSTYLMYYDVNNLYGIKDVANFDLSAIALDSPIGYILEVDLEYPRHLHDVHADLPFCPTRDKPPGKREDKLLATVYNKQRYVIHYRFTCICILDISKVCLYEFHYEYMSPLYHDKCNIMYTDTDSLVYRVECEDIYETMKRNIARFDTGDYPTDNVYGMLLANKKVPGLMKDENNGMIMTEFVGLRAKMYAVRVDSKKDTKKAKGVKNNDVARTITFDDYMQCLNEEIEMTRRQSCIRSKLHEVYTISESKIALNPYDDKRYIVPDSTETLPWGHWRIPL